MPRCARRTPHRGRRPAPAVIVWSCWSDWGRAPGRSSRRRRRSARPRTPSRTGPGTSPACSGMPDVVEREDEVGIPWSVVLRSADAARAPLAWPFGKIWNGAGTAFMSCVPSSGIASVGGAGDGDRRHQQQDEDGDDRCEQRRPKTCGCMRTPSVVARRRPLAPAAARWNEGARGAQCPAWYPLTEWTHDSPSRMNPNAPVHARAARAVARRGNGGRRLAHCVDASVALRRLAGEGRHDGTPTSCSRTAGRRPSSRARPSGRRPRSGCRTCGSGTRRRA